MGLVETLGILDNFLHIVNVLKEQLSDPEKVDAVEKTVEGYIDQILATLGMKLLDPSSAGVGDPYSKLALIGRMVNRSQTKKPCFSLTARLKETRPELEENSLDDDV